MRRPDAGPANGDSAWGLRPAPLPIRPWRRPQPALRPCSGVARPSSSTRKMRRRPPPHGAAARRAPRFASSVTRRTTPAPRLPVSRRSPSSLQGRSTQTHDGDELPPATGGSGVPPMTTGARPATRVASIGGDESFLPFDLPRRRRAGRGRSTGGRSSTAVWPSPLAPTITATSRIDLPPLRCDALSLGLSVDGWRRGTRCSPSSARDMSTLLFRPQAAALQLPAVSDSAAPRRHQWGRAPTAGWAGRCRGDTPRRRAVIPSEDGFLFFSFLQDHVLRETTRGGNPSRARRKVLVRATREWTRIYLNKAPLLGGGEYSELSRRNKSEAPLLVLGGNLKGSRCRLEEG
jgi:hypothetical protein